MKLCSKVKTRHMQMLTYMHSSTFFAVKTIGFKEKKEFLWKPPDSEFWFSFPQCISLILQSPTWAKKEKKKAFFLVVACISVC